jgi:hypothetical protein
MKICGTVLRPLRFCISARFSGADSMSISSIDTFFDPNSLRTRWQ